MNIAAQFYETREKVQDLAMVALWDDLKKQADLNSERFMKGKRVKAHKFHVVNKDGYYVNVILDRKNNIHVRDIITNEYSKLETAIQNICD